jgi:predicted GIY-YIG superfamily endonuclease
MVVLGTTIHEFLATFPALRPPCAHGGMAVHHDQPSRWHALHWRDHRHRRARMATQGWGCTWLHEEVRSDALVYVEMHDTINTAIRRERTLKTWRRAWKVRLITEANPNWDDLYDSLLA